VLAALDDRPDTAEVRARAHVHRAIAANHRGEFALALKHLAAGEQLLDPAHESSHVLRASLLNARSFALFKSGDRAAARESADAALAHCRAHLPPGDPRTIDALVEIAHQRRNGAPTEADFANIDAVVSEARLRGDPRDSTLGTALNLAALLRADGFRYEEAAALYQEAISVLGWHHGEGHEAIALLRANLGDAYFRLGRFDDAQREHDRSLAARRVLGERTSIAISLEYLARIAIDRRDFDRAAILLAEESEMLASVLPSDHYMVRRCRLWNAILLADRGETEIARTELESVLASHATVGALAAEHDAQARLRLGRIRYDAGEFDAGQPQLQAALNAFERLLGPQHRDTLTAKRLLDSNR
jgi:tetratricopeptide (TPR) repeat protein